MTDNSISGARADAIELLTGHHRQFEELWRRCREGRLVGDDVQVSAARELIALISRHDAVETQFLYPALRTTGDRGGELADHSLEEHQQARELLKEVDRGDVRDEETFATLDRAMVALFHHIQEEEGEVFPLLRSLGEERVMDLGDRMETGMKVAPTHPHPTTPNNPAGAAIAGAAMGLVDRARDALRDDER